MDMDERTYWCCLFTRDGAETLERTLSSIIRQSIPPRFIVVVDDGSTDATSSFIRKISGSFTNLEVVHTGSKTRDIRRAPMLLNLGIKEAEMYSPNKFMMISGDDAEFPSDYCKEIMDRMNSNPSIAVASGDWGMSTTMGLERQPHGAGRFVKSDFMKSIGNSYPVTYGWESWIIFKAMQKGFRVKNFDDLKYKHLRPYRPRNVYGWGRAMYSLGYPFYFVLFRFLRNILAGGGQVMSLSANFSMFAGYLASLLNPKDVRGMMMEDRIFKLFVKRACTSRLIDLI